MGEDMLYRYGVIKPRLVGCDAETCAEACPLPPRGVVGARAAGRSVPLRPYRRAVRIQRFATKGIWQGFQE